MAKWWNTKWWHIRPAEWYGRDRAPAIFILLLLLIMGILDPHMFGSDLYTGDLLEKPFAGCFLVIGALILYRIIDSLFGVKS